VEIVETSEQIDTFNRLALLDNAAAFYPYQGRNVEAETVLKHALEIAQRSGQTTDTNDVVRGSLASLYRGWRSSTSTTEGSRTPKSITTALLPPWNRVPIRTLESCCRKRWMNWAIFIIPRAGL